MAFPDRPADENWMRVLADRYEAARRDHPLDELCVVFDIDGTILDLRHLVVHVLLAYDRARRSNLFHGLVADDITVSENQVDALLDGLDVPEERRDDISAFYGLHLWDENGLLAACAPYRGVLSVIRWFQIRSGTRVALNTGRPEAMRRITLDSLNAVGEAARVRFDPELLFMRSEGTSVPEAKAAALGEIGDRGLRTVAVIDNEPDNLAAMAASVPGAGILFLHAETIFESQRRGSGGIAGTTYELSGLIDEEHLREHVELVWHGVNDVENLRQFMGSDITWAEIDLRLDPAGRLVLRHDGFEERPWDRHEHLLSAPTCLEALAAAGRSIKLDVKENGQTIREALDQVERLGLRDNRLWFNAEIEVVGASGFEAFRDRYPNATASCPIDFLVPLIAAAPEEADVVLRRLRSWGVTRLSLRWGPRLRSAIDELEQRGWETNVYAVPDLQSFLEAAVLLPTSVTADFNFPDWRYFGRGSGERGFVHRYGAEVTLG
jgi:phosphoglycolate phosphatase-like HAD superfamily hydrolase